jgi:hypothetical protein
MIAKTKRYILSIYVLIAAFSCSDSYSQVSDSTVIKGYVFDAKTGAPLQGVAALLEGTTVGAVTDKDGKYKIVTNVPAKKINYSFIGYKTESRNLNKGISQTINVVLVLSAISIKTVTVRPEKKGYSNKNNPAVELIEKVIGKKDMNNPKRFKYLKYEEYEKIQYAASNISEKYKDPSGKLRSIFNNIDTTKRLDDNILPVFIKESRSDHYFRRDPEKSKEILRAEKTTNLDEYLDNKGISSNLDYLYHNINIYDNEILFLTNVFVSPIANNAPVFYRYYIVDTLSLDSVKCIKLFFEPRNKADFLFHGHLYIKMDSSYAVIKIDMGLNKNINIDWVKGISITQDFDQFGQKTWLLSKDEILIDFGVMKNAFDLYGQRTIYYRNYSNEPIDEKTFEGPEKIEELKPASDSSGYWESNRFVPLTEPEKEIFTTIDSIKKIPAFRSKMKLLMLFTTGFLNLGKFEAGPAESFYSYNPVEGLRFRFGGRTTTGLSKKITFDSYIAYGNADKLFKYSAGVTYSLTPHSIYQFPVKSIRLNYQNDTRFPGQELQFTQGDNVFLSFKRGPEDKIFLNKTVKVEYLNEFENHFSYMLGYAFTRRSTEGNLHFNRNDSVLSTGEIPSIRISELNLNLRYAPNESFYQGKEYRFPFPGKYPVIQLNIAGGLKSLGNDFNYLRLQLGISRRYYFSILGYSDISIEAGKIFGKIPYPLLFIHNANQTYSYQSNYYNLMNFLEFVSDQYVSLNIDHSFNGFFLNKIPLLKKLKLREVVTCKLLYGSLSRINNPDFQNDLFIFPSDNNGVLLTNSFGKEPYIEAGVGVSNILKIFRIDLIKRFNYLNHPNVSDLGLRIQFRFDI